MNHFGPRLLVNLVIGLCLGLAWLAVNETSARYFPLLTEDGQRAIKIITGLVGATAGAFLGCLVFPSLRSWLGAQYSAAPLVALIGLFSFGGAAIHGREWAFVLAHGTLIPGVLLFGPAAFMLVKMNVVRHPWYRELFEYGKGHSALWASHPEYNRHQVELPKKRNGRYTWLSSILLGCTTFRDDFSPRYVAVNTTVHMVNVGMSGSAKSACFAWPILGTYGGAAFVVDPKDEHRIVTGRRRSELGPVYNCNALSADADQHNPLAEVDPDTAEGMELIQEIVKANVLDESSLSGSAHFSESAKTVSEGMLGHLCSTYPPEHAHFGTFYDVLMSRDPDNDGYNPDVWANFLAEMSQNPTCGGACIQAAKLLDDAGDEEGGSFLTTLSKSWKWLRHPQMRKHLSRSDFSMKELATAGPEYPTIYCGVGVGMVEEYKRYIRMMTATAIFHIRAEYKRTGRKPQPGCLFLLDEYPLYAKNLDCITSGFGTARELNITLLVQLQKLDQADSTLGPKNASLLKQNSTVVVLGVNNDEDDVAKWVSDTLGNHVVPEMDRNGLVPLPGRREMQPLMTRREVMDALQQWADTMIVFPVNSPPMMLRRCAYMAFQIAGKQRFRALHLPGMFDPPKG